MTNMHDIEKGYAKTNSGSINYQHYDNRARNIRSTSVWNFIETIFIGKKYSSIDASEKCDVVALKSKYKHKKLFNLINEAA